MIGEMSILDDEDSLCFKKDVRVINNNDFKVRCLHTGCFFALVEKYKEEPFWII